MSQWLRKGILPANKIPHYEKANVINNLREQDNRQPQITISEKVDGIAFAFGLNKDRQVFVETAYSREQTDYMAWATRVRPNGTQLTQDDLFPVVHAVFEVQEMIKRDAVLLTWLHSFSHPVKVRCELLSDSFANHERSPDGYYQYVRCWYKTKAVVTLYVLGIEHEGSVFRHKAASRPLDIPCSNSYFQFVPKTEFSFNLDFTDTVEEFDELVKEHNLKFNDLIFVTNLDLPSANIVSHKPAVSRPVGKLFERVTDSVLRAAQNYPLVFDCKNDEHEGWVVNFNHKRISYKHIYPNVMDIKINPRLNNIDKVVDDGR